MDRDSYQPPLMCNGPGDSLYYPPGGKGTELIALAVIESVDRFHEPDVALLNQIG